MIWSGIFKNKPKKFKNMDGMWQQHWKAGVGSFVDFDDMQSPQ